MKIAELAGQILDEEFVLQFIDDQAVAQLFKNHKDDLLKFLVQRVQCIDTAQDLSQESYLRLIRQNTLQHDDNLAGYLFKIAERLSVDFIRQNHRLQNRLLPLDEAIPCPNLETEELLILRQRCEILLGAIDLMPTRMRTIFLLRKIDELTYSQIAEKLSISEKTVQRHLVDAMIYCYERLDTIR